MQIGKDMARFSGRLGPSILVLMGIVWLALVWRANTDLSEGRFAIFMDEGVIFDGVKNILHPGHARAFAAQVLDGYDHRYGRILWNLTAVTSFLPERLWGATGLIVAERMTQALLYLSAVVVLALTFVRRWPFRLLLTGALLALPFADYYATMPKPEPLELLLVAIFFWFHKARNYVFGPHWFFLGLAFGAKIAVLPLVVILVLHAALQYGRGRSIVPDDVVYCASAFLLGLGLAVPILLRPILPAFVLAYLWRLAVPNIPVAVRTAGTIAAFCIGCFAGVRQIDRWLDFTFRNTAHGQDEAKITFFSWIAYFFRDWLGGPVALNIAVIAAACLLVLLTAWEKRRGKAWVTDPGLLLICGGAAMIGAIFVSSHRLWGFYLLPGMVLALTGLICLIEQGLSGPRLLEQVRVGRSVALTALAACAALTILVWVPGTARSLESLARRTEAADYRTEYANYRTVIRTLASYAKTLGRPISVAFDPNLFKPEDTESYRITQVWGTYKAWTEPTDLLVFGPNHIPGGNVTPSDSPEYPAFLAERAAYARYVISPGSVCRQVQCYEPVVKLSNGGAILARRTPEKGG